MYEVSGLPHVEFGGYIESVGGGGNMYNTYLSRYNQIINLDSPLSITQNVNIAGNNIIMQAEVEVTESITTSNHQIIFLTSHKHSDEYFCSVGSYTQQSFDLSEIGQQQVFENIIEIDENWDLENMDVVVLVQSMQNNRILQASSSDISLDNLLMLNTNLVSIENDDDLDNNLNPGENATLNFSLENSSILLNAENTTITISTEDNFQIESSQILIENDINIGDLVNFSTNIQISEDIPLGNVTLNLLVQSNYTDTFGDSYVYEVNFPIVLNINLYQKNWPLSIGSQIVSSPAIVDLNNDGNKEIIFGDYNGLLHVVDKDGNNIEGFPFEANDDIWSSPAVGDIDNDGQLEIVISSKDKRLYILDSYGEIELIYNANQFLMATPVICQIDQDPEFEIVISGYTSTGDVFAINHDGTDLPGFPASINEKVISGVASVDMNNNGLDDILVTTETQNMLIKIIDDGSIDTLFVAQEKFKSSPTVIKNDFENLILVTNKDYNLYAFDFDGNLKFIYSTQYEIISSAVIADIDSEKIGIFFGAQDGYLYGIDQNGDDLQGWPINIGGQFSTSPSIADLNYDGIPEIICGNTNGDLYSFDVNGNQTNFFPLEFSSGITSSPSIVDIDNDGDLDIFLGVTDMIVGIDYKDQGDITNYWNFFRGNIFRNGTYLSNYTGSCSNPDQGDLNCDGYYDVTDIVILVNVVLDIEEADSFVIWASDLNYDGQINVLDIIFLRNVILYD